ncbi:predicted protein [Sclerotinia sclerotiorum 1980 UF-70]|uniref:Uncharacterized protein n=1 Tax=Sclerotinia sclerotiorum (strain ATCC 18683 / 1980 / Ss-1) TaxID=665079 RepID=A7EER8_SCLS1|nr:predicted protein [Sclerotinia sclerotiorum 1980 UF-70]EDO01334.1 predicted protein [Sclerotinia sclerotiorum 1980 UF-70]
MSCNSAPLTLSGSTVSVTHPHLDKSENKLASVSTAIQQLEPDSLVLFRSAPAEPLIRHSHNKDICPA